MPDVSYSRVTWEDSPSTNTPISAANLNIMDKGISDCATEINNRQPKTDNNLNTTAKTIAGAINELNSDLSDFQFRNNSGTAQYSMDGGTNWSNFSSGTIYLGEYSANANIDVSALGATSVNQFLVVLSENKSVSDSRGYTATDNIYPNCSATVTAPSLSLSGTTLTVSVGSLYARGGGGWNQYYVTATDSLKVKVYFVGDITPLS